VDEGILRLTRSSHPIRPIISRRRRLGLDICDDWGRLIAPPDGEATVPPGATKALRPARHTAEDGDAVRAAGAGRRRWRRGVPTDLPDFNGQVRLMAVAWSGSSVEPPPATSSCAIRWWPNRCCRASSLGDQTRMTLLLHNLDLPAGEQVVTVSVDGPLAVSGEHGWPRRWPRGPGAAVHHATATGAGRHRPAGCRGTGGFHIQRETAITVRPARGRRRWWRPASLRLVPRCRSRRRSIGSWRDLEGRGRTFGERCAR
jgi:hypothetical protein